jgi:hypothetical protein
LKEPGNAGSLGHLRNLDGGKSVELFVRAWIELSGWVIRQATDIDHSSAVLDVTLAELSHVVDNQLDRVEEALCCTATEEHAIEHTDRIALR